MPSTTEEDREMVTGDKEEDLPLEEMYLLQDTEALLHASTVAKKDTMHIIVLKRSSHPAVRGNKPTS